jgi:hypothetical protein
VNRRATAALLAGDSPFLGMKDAYKLDEIAYRKITGGSQIGGRRVGFVVRVFRSAPRWDCYILSEALYAAITHRGFRACAGACLPIVLAALVAGPRISSHDNYVVGGCGLRGVFASASSAFLRTHAALLAGRPT